jgi:hypothetical protein
MNDVRGTGDRQTAVKMIVRECATLVIYQKLKFVREHLAGRRVTRKKAHECLLANERRRAHQQRGARLHVFASSDCL